MERVWASRDDGGTCPRSAQVADAPPGGRAVCLGNWTPGQERPGLQSPRPKQLRSPGAGCGRACKACSEVTAGP